MEITVLLFLTVPLSVASPLRPTHRSDTNTVLSGDTVQASEMKTSRDAQEQHVQALKIILFHSEDKHLGLVPLKYNMAEKLRPRRARQEGCKLGTCQTHNLANDLFKLNKPGRDKSKLANSSWGYGK
uniref:Adrenomedullin n=1 Tax=Echeneis naucrates TaxID=173247 RepID=A0A665UN54_ECHNA